MVPSFHVILPNRRFNTSRNTSCCFLRIWHATNSKHLSVPTCLFQPYKQTFSFSNHCYVSKLQSKKVCLRLTINFAQLAAIFPKGSKSMLYEERSFLNSRLNIFNYIIFTSKSQLDLFKYQQLTSYSERNMISYHRFTYYVTPDMISYHRFTYYVTPDMISYHRFTYYVTPDMISYHRFTYYATPDMIS